MFQTSGYPTIPCEHLAFVDEDEDTSLSWLSRVEQLQTRCTRFSRILSLVHGYVLTCNTSVNVCFLALLHVCLLVISDSLALCVFV